MSQLCRAAANGALLGPPGSPLPAIGAARVVKPHQAQHGARCGRRYWALHRRGPGSAWWGKASFKAPAASSPSSPWRKWLFSVTKSLPSPVPVGVTPLATAAPGRTRCASAPQPCERGGSEPKSPGVSPSHPILPQRSRKELSSRSRARIHPSKLRPSASQASPPALSSSRLSGGRRCSERDWSQAVSVLMRGCA